MADKNETYSVPGQLAVALQSGRGQFVELYMAEIDKGIELPREQLKEIVRLVGDMIEDNRNLRNENRVLRSLISDTKVELKEQLDHIEFARNEARKTLREMQQQIDELDED